LEAVKLTFNKKDVAKIIARRHGYTFQSAEKFIGEFCGAATEILSQGDSVALRGFGTFSVVKRGRRKSVCPRTRETIEIPETLAPKFTSGKILRRNVRAGTGKTEAGHA
jgi:DNA-binding protein HU-beta